MSNRNLPFISQLGGNVQPLSKIGVSWAAMCNRYIPPRCQLGGNVQPLPAT
ncbi:hypothetical protein DPMN_016969 [Dreissena polymorpha]|uniref:Uncharacterized protein n=1 Tax=Dreissena polymorpha TaxID=45954 RepID=A0A9D4NDU8_DREPO|nr:hypothetical protein DPMN_016969 [Dreissena polymorpha]